MPHAGEQVAAGGAGRDGADNDNAYVLIDELVAVDVAQVFEEGQRDERVGVSDLHEACHPLDQPHELLQLRRDVICGEGGGGGGHDISAGL